MNLNTSRSTSVSFGAHPVVYPPGFAAEPTSAEARTGAAPGMLACLVRYPARLGLFWRYGIRPHYYSPKKNRSAELGSAQLAVEEGQA